MVMVKVMRTSTFFQSIHKFFCLSYVRQRKLKKKNVVTGKNKHVAQKAP